MLWEFSIKQVQIKVEKKNQHLLLQEETQDNSENNWDWLPVGILSNGVCDEEMKLMIFFEKFWLLEAFKFVKYSNM